MTNVATDVLWLSPHASVRWEGEEVHVRSLLEERGVASSDPALLLVMHAFARPRTLADVSAELESMIEAEDLASITRELTALGLLLCEPSSCFWDAADLAYRTASNPTGQVKHAGVNPVPVVRAPFAGRRIQLARAQAAAPGSLARALLDRRSVRRFGGPPIALATLGELLERSVANRTPQQGSYAGRAYPSGGGLHSLEVYPVVARGLVDGLAAGVYHYAVADHALELISGDAQEVALYTDGARGMMGASANDAPPIVLLVTSRFRRVCEGYSHIAYRLVLIEVGCLLQTVYLVAQSLGLGACALGGVDGSDRLAKLIGVDELEEPLVGEMVVGAPPNARD